MRLLPILAAALVAMTASAAVAADIDPFEDPPPSAPAAARSVAATVQEIAPEILVPDPALSLVSGGAGLAVSGAAQRAEIDDDPTGGFALATPAGRMEVVPEDVGFDATTVAPIAGTDVAASANTADGADTLIKATPLGIETFTVIHGPEAPTEYTWMVSLPGSETMRLAPDGGVYVVGTRGAVIAQVERPWAKDAAGRPVGVSFSVDGDRLTLHVDHRAEGVAYPVIADPNWLTRAIRVVARVGRPVVVTVGKTVVVVGKATIRVAKSPMGRCAVGALFQIQKNPLGGGWNTAVNAAEGCASALGLR